MVRDRRRLLVTVSAPLFYYKVEELNMSLSKDTLTSIGYNTSFAEQISKYPDRLLELNGISSHQLGLAQFYDDLMKRTSRLADTSVDSNANVGSKTTAAILQEIDKPRQRLYALNGIWEYLVKNDSWERAVEVLDAIIGGLIYPHDLPLFMYDHYCYAFSAEKIMKDGLPFIPRLPSKPAQHARSFIAHVNQFIQFASNHQAGATALPGLWVAYAYYAKKDGLTLEGRQQDYQEFIFTCNQPVRYSAQSPFVNVSLLDKYYMQGQYGAIYDEDGRVVGHKFTYPDGSLPDWEFVDQIQREFYEYFNKCIDDNGRPITFPVITAAMIKDKKTGLPADRDFLDWFCKENVKHCSANILLNYDPNNFASCCRMMNYTDPLKYTNSFGAGGDSIGSWGVATLNLAGIAGEGLKNDRTGYSYTKFLADVKKYADMAREIVGIRRHYVTQNIQRGLLPLFTMGYVKPESLYLTVGIVGAYEALEQLGCFSRDRVDNCLNYYVDVLDILNAGNKEANDEQTNTIYNLEQVPAENAAVKLATIDRVLGRHDYKLLSNQWLPLSYNTDIFSRLEVSGALDTAMSGGAIVHISAGQELDANSMQALIDYASKTENVYFAVNYMFSCCHDCHTISHSANTMVCPKCGGSNLDKFTRVVGFITPLDTWSTPRREEQRIQLDLQMKNYVAGRAG